jgi:hypothetical protein
VQKKASTGLDADAFNWFPADCTFWAARDLRVQAGLSDEQLLILVQLLGDAGWRDRIWKLKSVVGRIDRIAAAYAPDPARFFVRLSGRINHDRLIDAFRTEFPFAHVQGEGSPMIGTITTISGLPSPAPVVALVNDSDLLLGGYVAADGPSAAVVAQMLNVRAGRYRRGRPAIPPHVWGVIVGEPPEPVRRLVTALTPLRLLPKKVSVSLNGDKTTELRLEATFATPADARSFADGLRALQKRGLAFVQDPPPPLYFTRGTAMLLDEALRTLTVGRDESTVNGEMRIRDQAFAALTDALRNLPLSALRPLLSGLKTVGEAAGRKAARERLAVLKQIAAETEKRFRAGLATADSLIKAKLDVCKAELELCESDKERVDVHERTVVLIRELENVLERHHRAGVVPQTAVLKAKADLLEAEAALERAKAAVGK